MNSRRLEISPAEVRRLYEDGLSITQIAQHFGCGTSSIYRRLKSAGTTIRPNGWQQQGKTMSAEQREKIARGVAAAMKRNGHVTRRIVECAHCGKEMERNLYYLKRSKRLFCSTECHANWVKGNYHGAKHHNWKKVRALCANCGRSLLVEPYRLAEYERVFCNLQCQGEWKERTGAFSGPNNPNWKGGVTPQNRRLRHSAEYARWREAVFEKDNYTCQVCGRRGGNLHAHHIKPWALFPELRFSVDNGQTLCITCHSVSHAIWILYMVIAR